ACSNERKSAVLAVVGKRIGELEYKELNTEDGILAQFDRAWSLVRASGTEPKIRITTEAEDEKEATALHDKVYELVGRCMDR
ncbi:MAG: hypothetical protein JSV56_05350, partial [Methanomassiliicoccales archaeon]